MFLLPPLENWSGRWRLPVCCASAAVLRSRSLGCTFPRTADDWAVLLAADPPLLFWVACRAAEPGAAPRCLGDVADWADAHADAFLALAQPERPTATDVPLPDEIADRVAAAVTRADLAARLALLEEPAAAETALFLGLVGNAADEAILDGGAATAALPRPTLPAWLSDAMAADPGGRFVTLADRLLAGEEPASARWAVELLAARRRGEIARRNWLCGHTCEPSWPTDLPARLARLDQLETQFAATLEAAKLESLAEFAAGAGHEINNPLAVISGRAQMLLHDEPDVERRQALALVSAQAMRIHEMIADMMLFARPPEPQFQAIDATRLVDQFMADFAAVAAASGVAVARAGESQPVQVAGDPTQLTVALRAVCQNAVEAAGRGGHIELAIYGRGDSVEIRVADDGPGIEPRVREHLFDPFFAGREAGRGLGLGLSKAWRIIGNHGGRIDVASQPGHGATFTMVLPCLGRQPPAENGQPGARSAGDTLSQEGKAE